jgi:hypothetical protein
MLVTATERFENLLYFFFYFFVEGKAASNTATNFACNIVALEGTYFSLFFFFHSDLMLYFSFIVIFVRQG